MRNHKIKIPTNQKGGLWDFFGSLNNPPVLLGERETSRANNKKGELKASPKESLPCVRGGGTRQGFPEANEMSFGGSLGSVTEGLLTKGKQSLSHFVTAPFTQGSLLKLPVYGSQCV